MSNYNDDRGRPEGSVGRRTMGTRTTGTRPPQRRPEGTSPARQGYSPSPYRTNHNTNPYQGERYGKPAPRRSKHLPVGALVAIDVVGLAVTLLIVWLGVQHLSSSVEKPIDLPKTSVAAGQLSASPSTTPEASAEPTDANATAGGTEESAAPTETAADANTGMWGAKFADKFASGDVEKTDNSYKSRDVNVTLEKVQENGVTYFWADIYVRNLENFKTAFGQGDPGKTDTTVNMAKENNAIVAISGDYFSAHPKGIVIRNGQLYRESKFQDVLVMNNDGSMETFTADKFDIDKVKQSGAWQAWSFGPMLLADGQPMQNFNTNVAVANPRSAVGYYEPGHYAFLLVDGRQDGYSKGMTMKEMSQLFYDRGCKVAYNLDGGQTAVMAFMGEVADQPYNGGRKVSDILYIGEKQ